MNVFVLNTKEDILKKVCNQAVLDTIDFNSRRKILLCFPHSSEYLPLCSEQTHSYRFGVNDDRIFVFRCTVPLKAHFSSYGHMVSQNGTLRKTKESLIVY